MGILDQFFISPETASKGDYTIATYLVEVPPATDINVFAAALAVEQTTGTWVQVPEETAEIRKKYCGKVVSVLEVPAYEFELPKGVESRSFVLQVAYPEVNFGSQIPMLLSTVIGNISMCGRLKLLDLKFSDYFMKGFKGPKFGVEGVRKILGVQGRPLLNNMIKPCTGYTPEVGAKLFYQAALGGVDIIKDDELIADPPFCPMAKRVELYMKAEEKVFRETGEHTLFTVNVTNNATEAIRNAKNAVKMGVNAVMLNFLTAGYSVLQSLADDPEINVPILAHLDFAGVLYESHYSGLSSHLVLGKLARLAGADIVVYPSPYGKFNFFREKHMLIANALTCEFGSIKRSFPMPGGGINNGNVHSVVEDLGIDCIIGCGGAIHGHPMGPTLGAKAMRQVIDAAVKGVPYAKMADSSPEVKAAYDLWGDTKGRQVKLFDLK
ncbi:MAG: ribulose 1,5-bisphosphate carboxylase [Planctomycetes bacterium]|nr:ribulose 1,5-bisphosphate carboxylase [Planctomycetota bacterium]